MSTPTFSSAATSADGRKVILTYDEALSSTTAATSAFTVRTGGIANNVNGVAISGSTVELTIANVIRQGQAVHASYVDPSAANDTNAVQDAAGNDAITLKTEVVNNQSTIASDTALEFNIQQLGSDLDGRRKGAQAGESVSLSENGQRVAIGSPNDRTIDKGRGSVRVYDQVGNSWQQIGSDIDGEAQGDQFGSEVSLSADGSRLAVGGVRNDVGGTKVDGGHVRIYQLVNNEWSQLGIDIDGESANDRSGGAVQLSGDGNTVIIGGYRNNNNIGHAKAYTYNEVLSQWVELGQEINGGQDQEYFGSTVDISEDGTIVAVGSVGFDPTINGLKRPGRGRVRVYELIENQWRLKGKSILGEGNNDNSGRSISLSADGNTIAIGANGNDGIKNKNGGHVRVYSFSDSQWTKVGQDIDGQKQGDNSGWSVELSSNGTRLAVASPRYEPSGKDKTGQARIYELQSNQWVKLGNISGEASLDHAGETVQGGTGISMSGNGQRFAIGARKNDGEGTNSGHTRVYDINNNGPSLTTNTPSIAENAAAGSSILNLNDSNTGTDNDPDGDPINYTITGGNSTGIFSINAATGVVSIASGKELDFETSTSHTLTIKATDGTIATTGTITINVTNINDNTPAIVNGNPTVAENAAAGSAILNINDINTGTDNDLDGNAISYAITAGNDAGLFSISAATGVISIAAGKALDFETATSHILTVQASDGANIDNASITVAVTNINDNAPAIANASTSVDEDKPAGFSIININDSTTENDTDADGNAITYSITSGNADAIFAINGASGLITIAAGKSLDFGTASSHSLTILGTDGTNTDTATIQVNVGNTDINAPSIANVSPSVAENADSGSTIVDINDSNTGNDSDNDGEALTYSITAGNDAGLFSINTTSGVLSIAGGKALDFETATSHTLTVQASDGTNTDNATLTINVTNINDNAPVIANTSISVAENTNANSALLNLSDSNTGNDSDNDGEALTYSITAGNDAGLFSINTTSGVLSIAGGKALDFETATSHTLTVQASDGTNTDNATLTINVTNINDNAPVIANTSISVAENTNADSTLLNLSDSNTGNDSDNDGEALTYSITAGNDAGLFSINTTSGVLSIAGGKALDFETATSHTLTVQASDGTNTDNATLTINVTNINDNAPNVADELVEVLETITPGSEITDLKDNLTTNDDDRDGDDISYSITSGNEEGLFAIEAATGKITLATEKSLDFDTRDQHILQIIATDGANTDTAQITIDVLDSNTAPTASHDSGTLNENATLSRTAENGIVQNNDTDAQGDSLTINQFQTGNTTNPSAVIGAFGVPLDGEYGQLTLQTNGSFSYVANRVAADELAAGESVIDTFTYIISDGKLTDTAEINFTINGINDAPNLVDAIKTKKYTEGQSNVTVIDGSLTIRDIDDTNIETASVAITGAFQATEDTLAFTNNFGITGAWNQGTGVLSLTGSTTKANYESALQTVTYTNTDNANPVLGLRTITWSINDGEANSSAITSQVDVGGVNDSPEADNEEVALNAGSSVSTTTGQAILLANDTDPEGNALNIHTFRLGKEQDSNPDFAAGETITGLYGQLTIEANGTYTYNANQAASQRLLTGEARTETFNYTIHDTSDAEDLGEITFTLTGINDKPTATDDTKQINENNNKFFSKVQGLLINDTDLDGDQLEITKIRTGLKTDTSTNDNATGTTVQGTYGSLILEVDGSYRYDANHSNADALDAGDIEADIFTYTLSDSQLEDKAEIRINVKGINDAPVLSAVTNGSIADQANSNDLTSSNLTGKLAATDADASASLSYGVSSVNTARSSRNNFQARHAFQSINTGQSKNAMQRNSTTSMSGTYGQLNIDSNTGAYTFTPNTASIDSLAANQIVTETFALFVSDGSLQSTQNFSIQISGANDVGSSSGNNQPTNTNTSTDTTADQTINTDGLSKTASQLISDNENSSFLVTGESGLWVQLEVLSANADWQNSLQIINADGYAIGSIGATGHSTNMGANEIFLSGGSTIRFQQSSNNQKLNQSPNLRISPDSDNSFMLYLEDSGNLDADYNDLSIKITTSQQPQNINAFKLSSEQYHINDSILNLTGLNPGTTKLRLTLESDCGDTNRIAFVKLTGDHANGFTVGGVASTDENAFEAAIRDSLINPSDTQILMEGKNTRQIEWTFDQSEEGFYSPVFINQRTNNLATYGITNAGNTQNLIKNLGSNFFGYEDTPSAQYSDWDFNDITMLVELL